MAPQPGESCPDLDLPDHNGRERGTAGLGASVSGMSLARGDRAPDLTLLRPDGAQTSLGAFRGEPTVLIFLRHLH